MDTDYHTMPTQPAKVDGQNSSNEAPGLLPYRDTKGRITAAASLLIPFGFIAFMALFSATADGKYELDAIVKIPRYVRIVYILHGLYFIVLPFSFELSINTLPFYGCPEKYRFGKIPARPDNLFWMMSCLAGELFFVAAVILFLLSSQSKVQRWTLILPMSQCIYNMKNSLFWVFLGNKLSPIGKGVHIMILDFLFVGACFIIYIIHFFTN